MVSPSHSSDSTPPQHAHQPGSDQPSSQQSGSDQPRSDQLGSDQPRSQQSGSDQAQPSASTATLPQPTKWQGIVLMGVVAGISFAINQVFPLVSAMLIAILIGVTLRNLWTIPSWAEPGIAFSSRTILRLGVVLLGLRLSLPDVLALGYGPIAVIFITVIGSYFATIVLGKLMNVAHTANVLTATGTSICGAAAVAGMAAVVQKRGDNDEDIQSAAATAIAIVTVFGTISLMLLPIIGQAIGLNVHQLGVWIGAGVHEVGQVVAGAGLAGATMNATDASELLNYATITKLGRVVLLAGMVAIVGYFEARNKDAIAAKQAALHTAPVEGMSSTKPSAHTAPVEGMSSTKPSAQTAPVEGMSSTKPSAHTAPVEGKSSAKPAAHKTPILPLFVIGFLVSVAIRSVVASTPLWDIAAVPTLFGYLDIAATLLLTVAMGAMGAGVHIRNIIRSGLRSVILGGFAAIIIAIISLVATLLLVT